MRDERRSEEPTARKPAPTEPMEEEIEEIEDLDAPAEVQKGVVGASLIRCETT
jgi:hypothetical protein